MKRSPSLGLGAGLDGRGGSDHVAQLALSEEPRPRFEADRSRTPQPSATAGPENEVEMEWKIHENQWKFHVFQCFLSDFRELFHRVFTNVFTLFSELRRGVGAFSQAETRLPQVTASGRKERSSRRCHSSKAICHSAPQALMAEFVSLKVHNIIRYKKIVCNDV